MRVRLRLPGLRSFSKWRLAHAESQLIVIAVYFLEDHMEIKLRPDSNGSCYCIIKTLITPFKMAQRLLTLRRTPISNTLKFDHSYAATQTYILLVQGQHRTRSIHSTNEERWTVVVTVIVVYPESKMVHEEKSHMPHAYCHMHQTPSYCVQHQLKTPSNWITPTQQ